MEERVKDLFNTCADYIGAMTSTGLAALGLLDSNSSTAIGASLAAVSKIGISEIANKSLAQREKFKIGTALYYAAKKIEEYLHRGMTVKYIDIYNGFPRSDAADILEGTLLKSKVEHEEKKLQFIGNVWASFAFREDFSAQEANHFLSLLDSLSYTKLCLMAFFGNRNLNRSHLRIKDFESDWRDLIDNDVSVLQQCFELHNAGLIVTVFPNPENSTEFSVSAISINTNYQAQLDWTGIIPSQMYLSRFGEKFYSILELQDLPDSDLSSLKKLFYQQGSL